MGLKEFFGIFQPEIAYNTAAATIQASGDAPPITRATLLWPGATPANLSIRPGAPIATGQNLALEGEFISTVTGATGPVETFLGPDGVESLLLPVEVFRTEEKDRSIKKIKNLDAADSATLRAAIARAGFNTLNGANPQTLIVSALDIDTIASINQQSLRDNHARAPLAIQTLKRATGAERVILAAPENLTEIANGVLANYNADIAELVLLPPLYPNGLPEILIKKTGAAPSDTLVIGLDEALAIIACLEAGKPRTEKTITFRASSSATPINLSVRIGTPIDDLLSRVDARVEPGGKIIVNGEMRGYACYSTDQPVTAHTDSIHVQTPDELFLYQDAPCTNCGKCSRICPVDLEVNLLGRFSEYGIYDKCRMLAAELCIECGLCAYICPQRRPLTQYIAHAKSQLKKGAGHDANLQEAKTCQMCGPSCPAIRLFDTEAEEESK